MSNFHSTGGTAYSLQQRKAISVATVRLRLLSRFPSVTARELADAITELVRADLSIGDCVDVIDALFDDPRIPAATVGAAYRTARMILEVDPRSGHA